MIDAGVPEQQRGRTVNPLATACVGASPTSEHQMIETIQGLQDYIERDRTVVKGPPQALDPNGVAYQTFALHGLELNKLCQMLAWAFDGYAAQRPPGATLYWRTSIQHEKDDDDGVHWLRFRLSLSCPD